MAGEEIAENANDRRTLEPGEYAHLVELLKRFSPADRTATKKLVAEGGYADRDCGICWAIRKWAEDART